MTPDTIRSGFRATGVYPVNRHTIKIPAERSPTRKSVGIEDIAKSNGISYLPLYSPHTSRKHVSFASSPDVFSPSTSWSPLSPLSPQVSSIQFTVEEEQRFQTRYEEGYDIPDTRYEQWLRMKHPDQECIIEREGECRTSIYVCSTTLRQVTRPQNRTWHTAQRGA